MKICKVLKDNGFVNIRQKGSHVIMQKTIGADTITVPVPNHKEVKVGTLQSIIRQSGLTRTDFL